MKTLTKLAFTAAVALAFSCSSDNNDPAPQPPQTGEISSSVEVSSSSGGEPFCSQNPDMPGCVAPNLSSSIEISSSSGGEPFCSQNPDMPGCVAPNLSSSVEVSSSSETLPSSSSLSGGSSSSSVETSSSSEEDECQTTNSALDCAIIQIPSSGSGGVIKSSSSSFAGQGVKIEGETVTYHGEDYPTVVIGTKTWFAKNLNYETEGKYYISGVIKDGWDGSFCFLQNPAYCEEYGRLYNWHAVMNIPESCVEANNCASYINTPHQGICPAGWHIPTKEEWWDLILFVNFDNFEEIYNDDYGVYDTYLKAKSGWVESSLWDNKDTYGFNALPGGMIVNAPGTFSSNNRTAEGYWWTSSLDFHYVAGSPYVAAMDDARGEVMLYNKSTGVDSFIKYYNFGVRCVKD